MPYYQFGALAFTPKQSDFVSGVEPGEMQYGERHVPYSNINIIDLGGKTSRRWKATIRVAPTDVVAWESAQGQTAELWVMGTQWHSATLVKMGNHQRTPLEAGPIWHFYDAEWVMGKQSE